MSRSRSIRTALRRGGVGEALSTMADDLAQRLDECMDPEVRLTLTRTFLVVCRDLSVNERAANRQARDAAQSAPKPKSAALSLVEDLRARQHA